MDIVVYFALLLAIVGGIYGVRFFCKKRIERCIDNESEEDEDDVVETIDIGQANIFFRKLKESNLI